MLSMSTDEKMLMFLSEDDLKDMGFKVVKEVKDGVTYEKLEKEG